MSRFVAMLGQEADTGACGAMKEAARQRGWTITAVGPSFWIAAERASVTRQSLAIGEVVLIGETVGGAAPVDSRVDNIDDACVDLTRKVWGRYVAVFLTPHGRLSGVFRDPSGAIDCVVSRRRSAWLIASDTLTGWSTAMSTPVFHGVRSPMSCGTRSPCRPPISFRAGRRSIPAHFICRMVETGRYGRHCKRLGDRRR